MIQRQRLGINIDHVATLRNARGGIMPDPIRAAQLAVKAGADGITAHLREDRRHMVDADMRTLAAGIGGVPLNMEMAATEEMLAIALELKPHAVCLVPEKREERTTEGGLDVAGGRDHLAPMVHAMTDAGIRVSMFIEASPAQLSASKAVGAPVVELHTGRYCDTSGHEQSAELDRIIAAAAHAHTLGLECHAGHGLNYDTVAPIAAIANVRELNIGHFLIGEAVFVGLEAAIAKMRQLMDEARAHLKEGQ